jgi:hypothetical protein
VNVCQSCGGTEIEVGEAGRPSLCAGCGASMFSNRAERADLPEKPKVTIPVRAIQAHVKKCEAAKTIPGRTFHDTMASLFHDLAEKLK